MSDDGNSSTWLTKPLAFPYGSSVAVCGVGYQTRDVECRKKDSGIVQDKLCGSQKPPASRDCTLPCTRDCVLSMWSHWSNCEEECSKASVNGISKQLPSYSYNIFVLTIHVLAASLNIYELRHRVVVQHRTGSGVPCSLDLKQERLCTSSYKCTLFRYSQLGPFRF